jgi:hypothetical protein
VALLDLVTQLTKPSADVRVPSLDEVPPVPRRPSRAARRLVFAYTGAQSVMRGAGIVFLLVGGLFSVLMGWGLPVDAALALTGARATGTVLAADVDSRTTFRGRPVVNLRYEYEVGGTTFTGEHDAYIEPPEPGGPIEVVYAPAKPEWSRRAGSLRAPLGWFGLIPLFFPIMGATFLVRAVRSNRREVRAFVHGRPALARVTYHGQDHSTSVNRQHPTMIRWEFRGPTGELVQGSLSTMRFQDLEAFGKAEQVVVLYDPAEPACNTLYVP